MKSKSKETERRREIELGEGVRSVHILARQDLRTRRMSENIPFTDGGR